MLKEVIEQKLQLAVVEAKECYEDPNTAYEAGAAGAAGQCDGWVAALEWVLNVLNRTFKPSDISQVQIKYTEPDGEGRTYSSKPMMLWEAQDELKHEAELISEGCERWPGVILPKTSHSSSTPEQS